MNMKSSLATGQNIHLFWRKYVHKCALHSTVFNRLCFDGKYFNSRSCFGHNLRHCSQTFSGALPPPVVSGPLSFHFSFPLFCIFFPSRGRNSDGKIKNKEGILFQQNDLNNPSNFPVQLFVLSLYSFSFFSLSLHFQIPI